jgi:hypothetical protein
MAKFKTITPSADSFCAMALFFLTVLEAGQLTPATARGFCNVDGLGSPQLQEQVRKPFAEHLFSAIASLFPQRFRSAAALPSPTTLVSFLAYRP